MSTPLYRSPRGTHDILPSEAARWRHVEDVFRRLCAEYGYEELRTPAFERAELFIRTVGEHTDIVSKEMFTVSGGRGAGEETECYVLRPEGTAPTLRACVQHGLAADSPLTRLYYLSPIFRFERPQSGRLRQHHQAGIEAVGSEDPALDAEVLQFGKAFLRRVGITGETLLLNTIGCPECRPAFRDAIRAAFVGRIAEMCDNCRRRIDVNPLRILDCKAEDPAMLEAAAPRIDDFLCLPCREHFDAVQAVLRETGLDWVRDPRLVRGLDYYVRTCFEFVHPALGAQTTVIGGGRYDGLLEAIGGDPAPGIGFGCGLERVLLICDALRIAFPDGRPRPMFVITLGDRARMPGLRLLARLRAAGIPAQTDYLGRSIKAQMRAANRARAAWALILGENELDAGVVALKSMDSGEQHTVSLDRAVEEATALTAA